MLTPEAGEISLIGYLTELSFLYAAADNLLSTEYELYRECIPLFRDRH